ncbi:MAG: RES domain-containing protein [Myxococcales bacterium]|nr:RES domain-containing protein [Myxococcales bacterium]
MDLEPHPSPPADLATRQLPIRSFRSPWFRSHRIERGALHFGRSGGERFDAPRRQFGVLYLGRDAHSAFIETFGRHGSRQQVTLSQLQERALAQIESAGLLRLVDLTGRGLARIGADARLATGNYKISQAWALALHDHPASPDGIYYRSRHDPGRRCAAIFDRASASLTARTLGSLADRANGPTLADLLDTYAFGLILG